jgi:hypothetical protein
LFWQKIAIKDEFGKFYSFASFIQLAITLLTFYSTYPYYDWRLVTVSALTIIWIATIVFVLIAMSKLEKILSTDPIEKAVDIFKETSLVFKIIIRERLYKTSIDTSLQSSQRRTAINILFKLQYPNFESSIAEHLIRKDPDGDIRQCCAFFLKDIKSETATELLRTTYLIDEDQKVIKQALQSLYDDKHSNRTNINGLIQGLDTHRNRSDILKDTLRLLAIFLNREGYAAYDAAKVPLTRLFQSKPDEETCFPLFDCLLRCKDRDVNTLIHESLNNSWFPVEKYPAFHEYLSNNHPYLKGAT